jgi:hypothetical protein
VTRITPEADFAADLAGIEEQLVIGGHTHVQFDRPIGRWRYVNGRSGGRLYEDRPGAYWAILGPDVELLRTDYDVEAAAAFRPVFRSAECGRGSRDAAPSALARRGHGPAGGI